METYISILRGINVSGHKQIKMADLKQLYAGLGFFNIQTYIQSGNVIFQSAKAYPHELELKIANQINQEYSFDVPVIVMETSVLQDIIFSNPFVADPEKDESFLHITFLLSDPHPDKIVKLNEIKFPGEEFILIKKAVYLFCPKGYGNTKLNNGFFENKLNVTATTRNLRTSNELLNIAMNVTDNRIK